MFKKINIKEIRESLALLVIAAIVGTIVSFVAQLFIISAKNIPSEVLTSKYEASTVMTVKTASAPKTIRYTLICSWIDSLL